MVDFPVIKKSLVLVTNCGLSVELWRWQMIVINKADGDNIKKANLQNRI
jgi:hypothetical protein